MNIPIYFNMHLQIIVFQVLYLYTLLYIFFFKKTDISLVVQNILSITIEQIKSLLHFDHLCAVQMYL